MATSAPVLYANTHHPELKVEFPNWSDRHKQIIKRWRGLTVDIKTPFNQKARENRTTLRMKKTQQVSGKIGTLATRRDLGEMNIEVHLETVINYHFGTLIKPYSLSRVAQPFAHSSANQQTI